MSPRRAYTPTVCSRIRSFDTEKILGRPARVVVDSFSGLAGIAFWINSYYGLKDEAKVDKKHPAIALMKEKVDEQYALGRTTVISDGELDAMLREADPGLYAAEPKMGLVFRAGIK